MCRQTDIFLLGLGHDKPLPKLQCTFFLRNGLFLDCLWRQCICLVDCGWIGSIQGVIAAVLGYYFHAWPYRRPAHPYIAGTEHVRFTPTKADIAWIKGEAPRGGGGYSIFMHGRSCMIIAIRPSHSYYAGTEHVEFSPTRKTLLAPSAKRREVFGESHEG